MKGQIRQAVLKSMGSGTDGKYCAIYCIINKNDDPFCWLGRGGGSVSISEIEGAVRELENEDLVQYLEKTQTVIIRG